MTLDPLSLSREQIALMEALQSERGPEFFVREILGGEPYDKQEPILRSVAKNRRTAVKSGHSCGKDWLAARVALWFHSTFYPSIVVTTGPTDRQVVNIVWGEIDGAYRKSRVPIGGKLLTKELQHIDPKTGERDKSHYMIGYTASDSEGFQGFHSDNVLVIVTEASGIDPEIWKGINALMTAKKTAKLFVVGNALFEPGSEFSGMFSEQANLYETFTLDSEESPYCSKEWIAEMRAMYGEDSPVYKARVKGIFSTELSDTLIPLGYIEKAHQRWAAIAGAVPFENLLGERTLGLDVARFGSDESVAFEGRGNTFKKIWDKQGIDLMQTAGFVVEYIKRTGIDPKHVRIDETGLGAGVVDRVREQGYPVLGINFGSDPSDKSRFLNARSELYGILRDRFRANEIEIDPQDRKVLRDCAAVKYKLTSRGQIQLESKEEQKKRTGSSPDYGDALAMAALPQAIASQVATTKVSNQGLLEYMASMSKKAKDAKRQAAGSRPVEELPGAAAVLEANREQPRPQTDGSEWRSVLGG